MPPAASAAKGSGGRAPARGRAGDVAEPTESDNAQLRQQVGAQDRAYQQAYTAGLAGEDPDPDWDEPTRQAWEAGRDEASTQQREERTDRARAAASSVGGLRGPDWVNDGAGFVLGMVIYALVLNYLRGGTRQARGWLAAKFMNRPYLADNPFSARRGGGR